MRWDGKHGMMGEIGLGKGHAGACACGPELIQAKRQVWVGRRWAGAEEVVPWWPVAENLRLAGDRQARTLCATVSSRASSHDHKLVFHKPTDFRLIS